MFFALDFEALGGSFLQVAMCRPDATIFAYRLQNLCIDSRVLPTEPGTLPQTVFNQVFFGRVRWFGPAPFEETSTGSISPRAHYSGGSHWSRRTEGDVVGISLCIPASCARAISEPFLLNDSTFAGTFALASHLLERRETSDAAFANDSVDAWLLWLSQRGLITTPADVARSVAAPHAISSDSATISALSKVLRAAAERPRVVDLVHSLGLSERQISRRLRKLLPAIGSPSSSFREIAHRWRLLVACVLLASRPYEKISVIATESGFSGTAALDHAFRDAGLGSPRELLALLQDPGSAA